MLKSPYKGIYISWKSLRSYDDIKIFCKPPGIEKQVAISIDDCPEYKTLRTYAKEKFLNKEAQEKDKRFNQYFSACLRAIARQYGLEETAKNQIALSRTKFDFTQMIDDFMKFKRVKSKGNYKSALVNFWMPLIINKIKIEDPNQWKSHAEEFVSHLFEYRKSDGEPLSPHSYTTYCTPIDEFIKFLNMKNIIENNNKFSVYSFLGFGDTSKSDFTRKRGEDYYSFQDYMYIKSQIDDLYRDIPEKKLLGYVYLLTLSTGIRRGNILGLKHESFKLDHEVPHIELEDNILDGNAYGETGVMVEKKSTKTTKNQRMLVPLRQPSPEVALEVAAFIRDNTYPYKYILHVHPTTFTKAWREMSRELGVRYIHVHGMRHSVATNGALALTTLYKGDVNLLRNQMTHANFRTTEKYLRKVNPEDTLKGYK
jgi:integrase